MRRYKVAFSEDAVAEFASSIQWGCENWGEEAAWNWYADMRHSIRELLGEFPLSQPIARDNDKYEVEVRNLIIGRYRVLFTVKGRVVTVLHLRGPYST